MAEILTCGIKLSYYNWLSPSRFYYTDCRPLTPSVPGRIHWYGLALALVSLLAMIVEQMWKRDYRHMDRFLVYTIIFLLIGACLELVYLCKNII